MAPALDFQAPLQDGLEGERPSIWGRKVYSPVQGTVISVRNDVPDNPLGEINYGENWGNYAILQTAQREHVALCHLEYGSMDIYAGQEIGFGTQIGRVGNSGRSSVPHLHLQAQSSARIGSSTIPLRIANYLERRAKSGEKGPRWHAAGLPREGDVVEPGISNVATHALLTGILPGRAMWVSSSASWMGPISTTTSLTDNGRLRIASDKEGAVELEYDVDALRVVDLDASDGSFIAALAMSLSTVPFAAFPGVHWADALHVPMRGIAGTSRRLLSPFLAAPLTHLEMTCADVGFGGMWLSGEATLPGVTSRAYIELTLERQKGPVRLVYRQGDTFFDRSLASFEVHVT